MVKIEIASGRISLFKAVAEVIVAYINKKNYDAKWCKYLLLL